MSDYQLTDTAIVIRKSDFASIPNDPANRDRAAYDAWITGGGVPDPYVPPVIPQSVWPQDLMAQFNAADAAAIQAAVATNVQFWLLWSAMQAQRDPMNVSHARFLAGWAALIQVLGQARMAQIATSLNVTIV